MIKKLAILSIGVGPAVAALVSAQAPGPCEQIVQTCQSAGFVKGDAKKGYGLWHDCIDPIMRGAPQPPNADKPLPAVPAEVIAACKQKHPDFGEGKKSHPPAPPAAPPAQ